MGFVSLFGKSMMKNAYWPKMTVLLQFGGGILALLCPDDSIQILLILSQFLTFGTKTKLEGFVSLEFSGRNRAKSRPQIAIRC